MSAPSLHIESTDSMIRINDYFYDNVLSEDVNGWCQRSQKQGKPFRQIKLLYGIHPAACVPRKGESLKVGKHELSVSTSKLLVLLVMDTERSLSAAKLY